jgi:hypothetical protein
VPAQQPDQRQCGNLHAPRVTCAADLPPGTRLAVLNRKSSFSSNPKALSDPVAAVSFALSRRTWLYPRPLDPVFAAPSFLYRRIAALNALAKTTLNGVTQ